MSFFFCMNDFNFLDSLVIMSMGMQMQTYIERMSEPSNSEVIKKLDYIISLLENSSIHCEGSNDNANKHL